MEATQEQKDIINASTVLYNDDVMKINACAGSGKTSTCVEIAKANRSKRILYLVFNKSMKDEAEKRFGDNTDIKTINGLAYKYVMAGKSPRNDYKAREMTEILVKKGIIQDGRSAYKDTAYLLDDLNAFMNSDVTDIDEFTKTRRVSQKIVPVWNLFLKGELEHTHSSYLKTFQIALGDKNNLNKVRSLYDMVILDEAQDTNPVTFGVVKALKLPTIIVGDVNQNIYGFRNTINILDRVNTPKSYKLTGNFRSAPHIIKVANSLLSKFKSAQVKKGLLMTSRADYSLNKDIKSTARIYRTNFKLICYIISLYKSVGDKAKFNIPRGVDQIFEYLGQFAEWLQKGKVIHPRYAWLNKFDNKNMEVLSKFADETRDYELMQMIKRFSNSNSPLRPAIVDEIYKFTKRKQLEPITEETEFLTTAHSAKGLEYDRVYIANDFNSLDELEYRFLHDTNSGITREELDQEINLAYVAYTRAKKILIDNSNLFEYDKRILFDGNRAFGKEAEEVVVDEEVEKALDDIFGQASANVGVKEGNDYMRNTYRDEEDHAEVQKKRIHRAMLLERENASMFLPELKRLYKDEDISYNSEKNKILYEGLTKTGRRAKRNMTVVEYLTDIRDVRFPVAIDIAERIKSGQGMAGVTEGNFAIPASELYSDIDENVSSQNLFDYLKATGAKIVRSRNRSVRR